MLCWQIVIVMFVLRDSPLRQLGYILPMAAAVLISWGKTPGLLCHRVRPNEGIRRAARRCLLIVTRIVPISLVSTASLADSLITAIPFVTGMFVMGLLMNWYAVAQHYLLRVLLAARGDTP